MPPETAAGDRGEKRDSDRCHRDGAACVMLRRQGEEQRGAAAEKERQEREAGLPACPMYSFPCPQPCRSSGVALTWLGLR